jgi:hypothetical protein
MNYQKAPFPWFGGKSRAAPAVWGALGDVKHYVEPFAGSMAVLLNRPHMANRTYYSETVCDIDGLLVNAWRGIQLQPEATADAASWPVSEADLHARHYALVKWREENQLEHLMGDPLWCDPVMAGWWLWGCSCWIGGGWCSGSGAWAPDETGRLTKRGKGVKRLRPQLTTDGQGVNRPQLREPGVDYHPVTMPRLTEWFRYLSARLRHVRIVNTDWRRVCTGGAIKMIKVRMGKEMAGIFLDPPYADTANRSDSLYANDSLSVAHDVCDWALANGDDPKYRIVMAGFAGEHEDKFKSSGWREVEWYKGGFLRGGMGNVGGSGNNQQDRERLWLSPNCLTASA